MQIFSKGNITIFAWLAAQINCFYSLLTSFYPQFSKSHVPLTLIIYESFSGTIHMLSFHVSVVRSLCSCACVHEGVHGFVHVHMNILIVTHASLQPFVMSLFYSETFYDVQIVWGFGDHQHNWQRHNECFSIFSNPVASLQLWKGSDALKLHFLAENVLYFSHKVYKGKFSIQNLTKLWTKEQIYRQIQSQ